MSNVRCFVQPTPILTSSSVQAKCESHLLKRLKWISKSQISENQSSSFRGHRVKECAVSNSYLAFLLDDGRVYRQKFGQSNSEDLCSDEESTYNLLTPEHRDFHSPSTVSRLNAELQSARSSRSTPGHHRLRPIVRSRERRAMMERWGALSGTGEVPEELIDQAMNVLQGKSREVVRRELMRTNLDVNLAVNNLLSHEDDVPDEQDGEDSLPVIPSGDDLLSFLASSGASHRIAAAMDDETSAIEGAMTTALRRYHEEEQLYNEASSVVSSGGHVSKKKKKKMSTTGAGSISASSNVTIPQLCYHGDMEWLCYSTEDGEDVLFAHIASLYSELIAVTTRGQLCQWKWSNAKPYQEGALRHPRADDLGLVTEEIKMISANLIRATVLTESLKFAVFYDETVSRSTGLLEHQCTSIIDLSTQGRVLSLETSCLFSAVLTSNGKIYWWGVLPFGEQKQQLEKWQEDRLNDRSFDRKDIKEGDKVMMRSRPLCSVGMKAVVLKHAHPVVGVLQESVFSLHEKYRFKLLHDSPTESCGSTLLRVGIKRSAPEEEEALGEVVCTMNDVIMVEEGQCATGTVLKVDGVYAAVSFSSDEDKKETDVHNVLEGCRLFRIDQLTSSSATQLPSPFQLTPKKLKLPSACKPLAMSVDQNGITVILSTSNGIIRLASIGLMGGVVSEKGYFPQIQMNYFAKQSKLKLYSMLPGTWLLEDDNGGLFPVTKDHIGGVKDFPFIPLSPIKCVSISRINNKNSIVCVVTKDQPLINSVLTNTKQFHSLLLTACSQGPNSDMFKERCAGDHNFLHLLSSCFLPPPLTIPPHPTHTGRHSSREGIRDLMRRANYLAAMGFVGNVTSSASGHHQESDEDVHYHDNPTVTSEQLAFMLQEDCKENTTCQQIVLYLLQQRNINGDTPFMTAVRCRNYPTAIKLLKISLLLTSLNPSTSLLSMLHPEGSHADDNPLFVLCHNEPCSYTWTGRDHIMQDVYECYNCGLTGSLCCCTECAFTCHRGHNCGFKRVSPSAYCDCPEKCSCHSLSEGSNSSRLELFKLLLDNSNLGDNQTARGEHLFDLLVSMEARANHDHMPWHVSRSEARRAKPEDGSMFVRKALIHVIKQWSLVKPSLSAGLEPGKPISSHQGNSEGHWLLTVAEQSKILCSQSKVQHLDVLVYSLTAKLPRMYLNMLVDTIMKSHLANLDNTAALIRRFIRSVARVFLVVWLDNLSLSSRDHLSSSEHCDKASIPAAAMERCTAVFESFSSLAIPELAQMCNALVTPITLGTYMSCPQSSLNEKPTKLAGELFKLPPVSLLRHNLDQSSAFSSEMGVATDDASDDETTVALSNRERLGGALLPYFRSVLCSSGESSVDELEESSSDSEHEAAMDVDDRPTLIPAHPKDEHWAIQGSNKSHHSELASKNSATLLAKAFERLLREVTSLLAFQRVVKGKAQLPGKIPVDSICENVVWDQFHGIWRWLGGVMDTMECQLRTGEAILSSSLTQQGNSIKKCQQGGRRHGESAMNDGKGLFSQYMLSVLCWDSGEHAHHPPVLDIMNMEHVAWILDGLLHFMMHGSAVSSTSCVPQIGHELKQDNDALTFFFTRSASVSCLGMPPISPFADINQSLPVAEWPQLLTAKASRDLLFHTSTQCLEVWPNCSLTPPPIISLISKPLVTSPNDSTVLTNDDIWGVTSNYLGASVLIGRWCMSCDLLLQAFGNHLRGDRKSVLGILGGFRVVEKLFHRDMEQYENNGSYKDSTELLVSREPSKLLSQVLEFFYNHRKGRPRSLTSLLAHVKVVFNDEPGQGTGVTRSLLTAVASCLLTEKQLPNLHHVYEQGGKSIVPAYSQLFGAEQNCNEDPSSPTKWLLGHESSSQEQDDGQGPLFYQPSRNGFYTIHYGALTTARLEAFHTVGNLIGYSLMMREMFPLPLCRHILKYILQQPVCWEDFAFFDPTMYETFRQLLLDARKETAASVFESMSLTFHVVLGKEEGGQEYDLIPNGALHPVTPDNVLHYISKYAYLRMVYLVEEPLQKIVEGIRDIIPNNCSSFSMLTPEDLRLLLNGTCQVDIELLKSITTFTDESHKNSELIEQFKGWFWSLVERMNNKERQDLLYFWTSSPVTPPTPEGYHPMPTITIRPMDDQHLPTANTCISRLYVPLYSSRGILKSKLLLAIKTKYFGFV